MLQKPELRIFAAVISALLLWGGWLLGLFSANIPIDRWGNLIGTDFIEFYAAAKTLLLGKASQLYDISFQGQLQREIIGGSFSDYYAFLTPPFFAILFVPIAMFSYIPAFILWTVLSLAFFSVSLFLLKKVSSLELLFIFSWLPVFSIFTFGQNTALSMLILVLTYRQWKNNAPFRAGLFLGLLSCKPQLMIGTLVLGIVYYKKDCRLLAGAFISGSLLFIASYLLIPDAFFSYFSFAVHTLPDLPNWLQFPLWELHSLRGFWRLLIPAAPLLADLLYVGSSIFVIWRFFLFYKSHPNDKELLFASSVCLGLLITPHLITYDLSLLIIPAFIFLQVEALPAIELGSLFSIVWIAGLLSAPLTLLQFDIFPAAIQVSVPALLYSTLKIWNAKLCMEKNLQ